MKTTVSEPETWKRVIDVEISADEVCATIDAKLNEYKREARLPGFRQGKVPIGEIKRRFGESAKGAAIEDLMQQSFKAACTEHNIEPVGSAALTDIKEHADGEPLRFTLQTEVDPPIDIKNYDKHKVKIKPRKIPDSDVDDSLSRLIERFAEFEDVERGAKKGDYVRAEYRKVVIDGEERSDLKNHNPGYPIEIGGDGSLKEFDRGLTGAKAGDDVEIIVKFPKDYAERDVAGKTGAFSIAVLSVQEKRMPEINSEFLKKIGDFETVEALKADIRKHIEAEEEARAAKEAHNEIIETLIKDNPFDVPPTKIASFVEMMIEDYERQNNNKQIESKEELAELYRGAAIMALKRIRIIDFVANKEKIKATQEEVDNQIKILAQSYGHDFDELKQLFRKNGTTNRIRLEIRERKTLDFLSGGNDN